MVKIGKTSTINAKCVIKGNFHSKLTVASYLFQISLITQPPNLGYTNNWYCRFENLVILLAIQRQLLAAVRHLKKGIEYVSIIISEASTTNVQSVIQGMWH